MSLPGDDSALLEPTPEALAERLLDLGDPDAALEVLDRALRRDPGSDRARALRSRALLFKRNEHALTPRPSAVDDISEELAEAFIQRGFLEEAQVVYKRVVMMRRRNPDAVRRAELLARVLSYQIAADVDPRQRRAEDLVAVGRLASALAEYRALARDCPDDPAIVGRANDLRMLVLGRDAPVRRTMLSADLTTAVGASPRAAASMLEEGKLEEALVELQRLAMARPELTLFAEASTALDRLIQGMAAEEARDSVASPGLPTRPVRQVSFVEIHIRLGNLAAAAELCRGMVERSPADELSRERLADLRTIMRFIVQARERRSGAGSTLRGKSTTGPGAPAPDVPLRKASRSQDFSGYRPSTEPGVLRASFRADEDVTAVVRPEEQAELYLRQGFLDKAAEIYRTLVVRHPSHLRFRERLVYVERKMRERDGDSGAVPAPSVMELMDSSTPVTGGDVELTPVEPPPPEAILDEHERPTTVPPGDEAEMVFPSPPTESFPVASGVRKRPQPADPVPTDPHAEADEKTPVSALVFEDQPTGRDALADRRAPSRAATDVEPPRGSRPTPTAPDSPAPVDPEAAPTTALPVVRRKPLPGLVRDSAGSIERAPADFEADPAVPTAPARWSDVEHLVAQSRGSEPSPETPSAVEFEEGVTFDADWAADGLAPPADEDGVEYPVQDDGIAAYGEDGALSDDAASLGAALDLHPTFDKTPPDGTPMLPGAEPAGSKLATVAMPQMTLPITPVVSDDGTVTMRQIIVVGPKKRR